jgi:periplasmic protein TonB
MRVLAFILLTVAAMPGAVLAADAEGCVDLKLFPRLEGCIIQECSAKQHDSFESANGSAGPLDANVNALTYTCPAVSGSMDPQRIKRELDAELRKAGYQTTAEDKSDAANLTATARKGSHWLRWEASSEDGDLSYTLTSAETSTEKFKAEACGQPRVLSAMKECEVVECASKSEGSVAMRTALKEETSLAGNVQTVSLVCPAIGASQALSAVEDELKGSGFEIMFSDREHPESGWVTGRAGKRWVELVGVPEGESVSYALTVVPSAEVLTAAKPEPSPVPDPRPEPAVQVAAQPPSPPTPEPIVTPVSPPTVETPVVASLGFVPPNPILEVPIEATHDRVASVTGEVVIHMLLDINQRGAVIKAELTGHITRDVLKLESAALDAVWRWRFEPARQDGRAVSAVKIPVEIRFQGHPRI